MHDVTARQRVHDETIRSLAAREVQLDRATALQALLREQAMHDPLTGLLNRRALEERYLQETFDGEPRPLALVLMDQALRQRAQCGDVGDVSPRIPGVIETGTKR